MFTIVSMAAYAGILWVLGAVVIRERRRAHYMNRIQTKVLPYAMSPHKRS